MLDAAGIHDVRSLPHTRTLSDHHNRSQDAGALRAGLRRPRSPPSASPATKASHAIQHARAFTSRCGCARCWCRRRTSARRSGYMVMVFRADARLDEVLHPRRGAVLDGHPVPAGDPAGGVRRFEPRQKLCVETASSRRRSAIDRVLNAAALTYVAAAVSKPADAAPISSSAPGSSAAAAATEPDLPVAPAFFCGRLGRTPGPRIRFAFLLTLLAGATIPVAAAA